VFEAYLEHSLALELKEGRVVVMDNSRAHKPDRVRELIEDRSCEDLVIKDRPGRGGSLVGVRGSFFAAAPIGLQDFGHAAPCNLRWAKA
jgi:hypothetical protein